MKKSLFIAFAAAGMLSSCSQNEVENASSEVETGKQAIQIGISHQTNVETRGTGTIGTDSTNFWNGQNVNVFMVEKGTTKLAVFDPNTDPTALYDNAKMVTPVGAVSGTAELADNGIKYYPTQGRFDFWGYRLDDAVSGDYERTDEFIKVPFIIKGSQDVMTAKAGATTSDSIALGTGNEDRAYSAFSARHSVQPNLIFKHLLTRLTFAVKAGTQDACNPTTGIFIDSIKVISQNSGKLVAVYTGSIDSPLEFDGKTDSLSLMQRKVGAKGNDLLEKLTPIQPQWNTETNKTKSVEIGEALLVAPAENYKMTVFLSQPLKISLTSDETKVISYSYDASIVNSTNSFSAGHSYKVVLTLYGLQKIEVNTTLEPWINGESVELTPEDMIY